MRVVIVQPDHAVKVVNLPGWRGIIAEIGGLVAMEDMGNHHLLYTREGAAGRSLPVNQRARRSAHNLAADGGRELLPDFRVYGPAIFVGTALDGMDLREVSLPDDTIRRYFPETQAEAFAQRFEALTDNCLAEWSAYGDGNVHDPAGLLHVVHLCAVGTIEAAIEEEPGECRRLPILGEVADLVRDTHRALLVMGRPEYHSMLSLDRRSWLLEAIVSEAKATPMRAGVIRILADLLEGSEHFLVGQRLRKHLF